MSVFYPNSDKPMPMPHREEREAHEDFLRGILKVFFAVLRVLRGSKILAQKGTLP